MAATPGRVAVVTGASRGIGRATALKLAADGCRVVVNYHQSHDQAEDVVTRIRSGGGEAITLGADVSTAKGAQALIDAALATFGQLDILVNNAGERHEQLLVRLAEADWERILRVNLTSAFLCTQRALRPMIRQKYGRIINVSSIAGVVGNLGQAHYSAAKGGLIAFTKSVAREVGERPITSNAVAPGLIDTDMTAQIPAEWRDRMLALVPRGKAGTSEDVAAAIAFLASEQAGYITGQVLHVDGGLAM